MAETAASWQLRGQGGRRGHPVADHGSINDGGRIRSDDLVLPVTAPFGGKQIQWSFVVMDAGGQPGRYRRVGVVHEQRPEQPAVDRGVLDQGDAGPDQRDDAVQARRHHEATAPPPAATPGPTRSATAARCPTRASRRWRAPRSPPWPASPAWSGSRATATTCAASPIGGERQHHHPRRGDREGGYARRPFLLLDPFVARGAAGNDVLLEPDPPRRTRTTSARSRSTRPRGARRGIRAISYGIFTAADVGRRPALVRPRRGGKHRERPNRLPAARPAPPPAATGHAIQAGRAPRSACCSHPSLSR